MEDDKKILVLVESIDVNDSSGSKANVALIQNFSRAGYKVTVLHYTQKKIEIEGVKCIAVREKKFSFLFLLSRFQRLMYRWFKKDVSKYVDSIYGFSFGFFNDVRNLSEALKHLKPKDYDMIWTFGKGTSFRPHAALLKNPEWHQKWYAYVHDPYPQHLYPRPYNFVEYGYKKKRMFFREITLKAHKMVFPSLLLKEWMQSYFTAIKDKNLIIPHQLVNIPFTKDDLPQFFQKEKFNLLHAGNLLDLRDPKPVVEAFVKFLQEVPEAKNDAMLYFIGKASVFQEYLQEKAERILQLYVSDDYIDFQKVYAMQQNASVNIILEAKSEISPFLPGKFPHCVAADKPIFLIGPYYSECKRLLGKSHPYWSELDDEDTIVACFKKLYKLWKQDSTLAQDYTQLADYLSPAFLKKIFDKTENQLLN